MYSKQIRNRSVDWRRHLRSAFFVVADQNYFRLNFQTQKNVNKTQMATDKLSRVHGSGTLFVERHLPIPIGDVTNCPRRHVEAKTTSDSGSDVRNGKYLENGKTYMK